MKLKTLDAVIQTTNAALIGLVLASLVAVGCGTDVRVKGGSIHHAEVSGTVTNEVVLRIDVSGCSTLTGQDQTQCIRDTVAALGDLVELVKTLSCKDASCYE